MDNKIADMSFSSSAQKQVKKLIAASNSQETALRVTVSSGGCSGFQYHFDFDNEIKKDDRTILSGQEILGVIDETSHDLLQQSQIDFVDEIGGNYFKINNPNASSSCGCGSSFSV